MNDVIFLYVILNHIFYTSKFLSILLKHLEIEIFVSSCFGDIWSLMANGRRIVQKVRRSITPFLDDWFLDTTWVMFGVDTNFFWYLDTVWFGNKSEMENI